MEPIKIIEQSITALKYSYEDKWLESWAKDRGQLIIDHPLYLALHGELKPLDAWCRSREDIWVQERLDALLEVYKSLIIYGQLKPIEIRNGEIVTGHKRSICLLTMGHKTIKAIEV